MIKIMVLAILLCGMAVLIFSCNLFTREQREEPYRYPFKGATVEQHEQYGKLYWSICRGDVDKIREYMEAGYDPDKCSGENWWSSINPLDIMAQSWYTADYYKLIGRAVSDPPEDEAITQLLIDAGADIHKRPYVWIRVVELSQNFERDIYNCNMAASREEAAEKMPFFVADVNRILELFLKNGADPDKRGHPYPYSRKARYITDENAEKYFAQGTRAINEAIQKGIKWESQVDLLLQYTTLDEDSLAAARQSKDPAMIAKIEKLWQEQQKGL